MPTTNTNQSLQITTSLGTDKLVVVALSGAEYISEPFAFTVTASATEGGLDPTKVSGKSVTLTLIDGDGNKRYINGLAARVAVTGKLWSIDLVPWLSMLRLSSDNRIFQSKTVPEILEAVFKDAGYTDYSNKLTGSYTARDYCVQYGESNFDFVHRLMEDEGIWYCFEHASGKHTLILGDDASAHATCPSVSSAKYLELPPSKSWLENNRVEDVSLTYALATGKYQADDFNFETPATELKANATGSTGVTDQQIYEYPGGYTAKDAGSARASKRLEAYAALAKTMTGRSDMRFFTAGYKFTLTDHPDTSLNADWILYSVQHQASADTYSNSFTAIPSVTVFRPVPRTPKPRIAGSQTAIVTGKSGKEIWTDSYGRIKVQFHWDQLGKNDENTTCWIRVAQGWAGKGRGLWALPRIGDEVVVSFLDGDPDRPLVNGSVYNGDNTLPYAQSDNITQSGLKSKSSENGEGYNEIRIEDKTDNEEILVHARKDLTGEVEKGNRSVTISEGDDSLTITKGNRTATISEGNETCEVTKGTRTITVGGDETHTSKGNFTHKVEGDYTLKVSGDLKITVSGALTITSDSDVTIKPTGAGTFKSGKALTVQAGTALTAKSGTAATFEGGTTVTVKGATSGTVDGGVSLTVKGTMVKIN